MHCLGRALAFVLLSSSLAQGFQYTVGVGKDETTGKVGIGFDPSSIRPAAGDTIVFVFQAGTHSAVQTNFDSPCVPGLPGGYDSGSQTVPASTPVDAAGLPTTTFAVTSTDPLWFYDGAPGECQHGAVFTVNPPLSGDQTAAVFLQKAKAFVPPTSAVAVSMPPASSTTSAAPSQTSTVTTQSSTNAGLSAQSGLSIATLVLASLLVTGITGGLFIGVY